MRTPVPRQRDYVLRPVQACVADAARYEVGQPSGPAAEFQEAVAFFDGQPQKRPQPTFVTLLRPAVGNEIVRAAFTSVGIPSLRATLGEPRNTSRGRENLSCVPVYVTHQRARRRSAAIEHNMNWQPRA